MEILCSAYHIIDVENERTIFKNITGDMSLIVKGMVDKISSNTSPKRYKSQSDRTVTVSMITEILKLELSEEE